MLLLDQVAYSNRLRRRHPAEKVLFSLGMLAICLLLPPWPACGLTWGAATGAALVGARISPRALLRASVAPLAFLAFGALPLLVNLGFDPSRGVSLTIGSAGTSTALAATLRSLAALSCLLFLGMTTPLPELLLFARSCRVPAALVETALVIYNMLFLLLDASRDLVTAQGGRLGYASLRSSYRSLPMLWSGLLVKALSRARRLETGLASRGFQGDLRVVSRSLPPSPWAVLVVAAMVAAVAVLSLLLA